MHRLTLRIAGLKVIAIKSIVFMGGVTRVARTFVASREGGKGFGGGDTSSITWRKVEGSRQRKMNWI